MHGWGLFFLIILLLAILSYVGWIAFDQFRARRAGRPPPYWKHYVPFVKAPGYRDSNFPSPRRSGLIGWIKDRFPSRNNRRTAPGAYEEAFDTGARGSRRDAHGPDADEPWNAQVGGDADFGPSGYYEEQELGLGPSHGQYEGSGYGHRHEHGPALGEDQRRGRSRSRDTGGESGSVLENPFGDEAEHSNLRDVSPRPDISNQPSKSVRPGPDQDDNRSERRSIFREGL